MGSYITIINDTNDTFSIKLGADKSALAIAGTIALIISCGAFAGVLSGGIVSIGAGISIGSALASTSFRVHAALKDEGFITLKPGESYQSDKMTLSLWQQCHCVRTRSDENDLVVEELFMKPIFSGPTNNSNNDYFIQSWIDKKGVNEIFRHSIPDKN